MYSRKSIGPRMEPWEAPALNEYSCRDFPNKTLLLGKEGIRAKYLIQNCIGLNFAKKTSMPNPVKSHSFLQGWNTPFLRELSYPFWVPPSFWSKFKKLLLFFWEPSKLVHVNCKKHLKMKVLSFILY